MSDSPDSLKLEKQFKHSILHFHLFYRTALYLTFPCFVIKYMEITLLSLRMYNNKVLMAHFCFYILSNG